jgi:nucleoside-diphosphate-sugar epimerase
MRTFVTGASGFVGRALCAQLLEQGHEVSALVRRSGSEPRGTRGVLGDLTDGGSLSEALAAERPDCVFHLAAEIASQRSERKVMSVNVEGTAHLLDACLSLTGPDRPGEGPRVVFASTVVTGEAHGSVLTEDAPLPVQTPYGRSKQEGERLVLESGLPAVVIRPSHVYGPGGWYANELIPRLRQPGRLAVVGDGENLWDVVHLALPAQALGVGRPRRIPVWLARVIAGGNAVDAAVRSARSSNAKIKRELSWEPRYRTAREGVADAVARLPSR